MKFAVKPLTLAIAAASFPLVAAAQPASNTNELETVTVWGTRVSASSIKMDEDSMAIRQADHVSDLLRIIPGVDVGGAHSLNQRITIRSLDDKDLRISIDGANQNTYMYHHMGNLQIHADILQSVDIDVGTNSVINGGLGGSVRFETKKARDLLRANEKFGARVQASYADNAGSSYSASGYGQLTDSVDVLAYYNAVQRDNFDVGGRKIKDFNGDEIAGTDGEVKGLEGDIDDALVKFGWDLTPDQRIEFGYEAYTDEGDYSYRPDMGLATDIAIAESTSTPLTYPTEFTRDTYTLNYDINIDDNTTIKTALFRNESEFWRDERALAGSTNPRIAGQAGIKQGNADNNGLNILATTDLGSDIKHTLTYGTDSIIFKTAYRLNGARVNGERARSDALFIQDRIAFNDYIAVIPGVRYEHYDIEAAAIDDTFTDSTGALALEVTPTQTLMLRASSTQLFKGPELSEVFIGAGINDEPNPDLDAETGYNHELAVAYKDAVLGADNFTAGITAFRTEIKDYIYDYAETDVFYGKDNVGDMQIDGYEAYIGYDIGKLTTLLSYDVAESDLDAFAQYTGGDYNIDGARIDREQGDTLALEVGYAITQLNLSLHWDVLHVDDLSAGLDLDGATVNTAKDGYTVHNVSASWSPATVDGLTLTLGVDNLFDEYYASQSSRTGLSGHPVFGDLYLLDYEPGRNIKATVAYQF